MKIVEKFLYIQLLHHGECEFPQIQLKLDPVTADTSSVEDHVLGENVLVQDQKSF